ncbi:MAG: VanZ family protein [Tannerellaceae bacterium]|jgi:VanZ family protein|nr:VanZ family protein [Tannerellaceae bacterium]
MLYYIKKYPFSLTVILIVTYLSFFRPPSVNIPLFEGFDKVAHFFMYAGLSGMLWLEFLRNHRTSGLHVKRVIIGAVVCPVLFGGLIELGQACLTQYRGGDPLDFLANSTGVLVASLIAWYILRPMILKRR